MGRANQISSVFWLIVGLGIAYSSHRLGLGTLTNPGPGFLPFWCGSILSGLSALVFLQGNWDRRKGDTQPLGNLWAGKQWSRGGYVVLAILAYTFTFTHLGFILSTTLLLIFLFKAIEPEKWALAIGGALLASFLCFVVFSLWLDVQLPRGILEKIIF